MQKINFDKWISENNIDNLNKNYSKGWWEYIEFIRKLQQKINCSLSVIASYEVNTPPPQETIVLPLILLEIENYKIYLKEDFSYCGFLDEWMVSIESLNEIKDLSNFLNPVKSKSEFLNEGFKPHLYNKLTEDFKENNLFFFDEKNRITGTVKDSFDLYALIKFLLIK